MFNYIAIEIDVSTEKDLKNIEKIFSRVGISGVTMEKGYWIIGVKIRVTPHTSRIVVRSTEQITQHEFRSDLEDLASSLGAEFDRPFELKLVHMQSSKTVS